LHIRIGNDATHVVVRDWRYLDRHFCQIDAIVCEPVDNGSKGLAQRAFRAVLKTEIHPAMRRAAAGFDLLENCVTADIPRDDVFAIFSDTVVLREFLHPIVQQTPA
jgi:hypothetical protein